MVEFSVKTSVYYLILRKNVVKIVFIDKMHSKEKKQIFSIDKLINTFITIVLIDTENNKYCIIIYIKPTEHERIFKSCEGNGTACKMCCFESLVCPPANFTSS